MDWSGSGQRQLAASCECGNEPFEFHNMREISWVFEALLSSQEGLCFIGVCYEQALNQRNKFHSRMQYQISSNLLSIGGDERRRLRDAFSN